MTFATGTFIILANWLAVTNSVTLRILFSSANCSFSFSIFSLIFSFASLLIFSNLAFSCFSFSFLASVSLIFLAISSGSGSVLGVNFGLWSSKGFLNGLYMSLDEWSLRWESKSGFTIRFLLCLSFLENVALSSLEADVENIGFFLSF